jgi:hypothetical protein
MKQSFTYVGLGLVGLSLFGLGCNPTQSLEDKLGEKVAESALSGATGGKVDVDINKGTYAFNDQESGNSISVGENVKLPDDFPKNVPVYPGGTIAASTFNRTSHEAGLNLISQDAATKVTSWYNDETKKLGWVEDQSANYGGSEFRTYKKGNEELTVTIIPPMSDEAKTVVTVSWKQSAAE